jgi:hypothetical protein
LQRQKNELLATLTERNASFFELELDKLDRWSDDLKVGLEYELKKLDRQIREARRSAQIAPALAEKLSIQKQVRELDAARTRKRRELFDAQDRIDKQRQDLIETIEKKLQQDCTETPKEFISAWMQHIPERYEHAVRSFGLFSPRTSGTHPSYFIPIPGQSPKRSQPKALPWNISIKRDFGWDPLLDSKGSQMKWARRIAPALSV